LSTDSQADRVLLVVDMITDYGYPDAEAVEPSVEAALPAIVRAREAADAAGVPVVYANDLADDWTGSRDALVRRALRGRRPDLVSPILPRPADALFYKGQHSAFYGTPLAHFLHELGAREVVLTGQVTEQCILYTALDAYVRDLEITVLADAVAALDDELGAAAVEMMRRNMHATVVETAEWALAERAGAA
jgi:nicotinamidase-related amidase